MRVRSYKSKSDRSSAGLAGEAILGRFLCHHPKRPGFLMAACSNRQRVERGLFADPASTAIVGTCGGFRVIERRTGRRYGNLSPHQAGRGLRPPGHRVPRTCSPRRSVPVVSGQHLDTGSSTRSIGHPPAARKSATSVFIVACRSEWHEVKRVARYQLSLPEPYIPLSRTVH
jgi:hypothetical protein